MEKPGVTIIIDAQAPLKETGTVVKQDK